MAICGIVVDLAHFNIHKVFITLIKSTAITGSGAGCSLARFLAHGVFIHLLLMGIIWPQNQGQTLEWNNFMFHKTILLQ